MFCALCCGEERTKNGMFDDYEDISEQLAQEFSLRRETQLRLHAKAKRRTTIYATHIDVTTREDFTPPVHPKNEDDRKFIDGALGDNFIFFNLHVDERNRLIDAMQREDVVEGTAIIEEGDDGDYFYIVQEGVVKFVADGAHVGDCTTGGSFGELALLYNSPRAATCVAETDCRLWKVDQVTFRLLLARQAHEEQQDVKTLLAKIPLFEHLGPALSKFVDALTPVTYSEGERIVTKGNVGDVFYIIQRGEVKVHDIGLGDSQFVDQVLTAGDWFGERALLTGERRAANVTALTDCICLAMTRDVFETTFGCLQDMIDLGMRKRFLRSVPIFSNSNFDDTEIDLLAHHIIEVCYSKGQKLCEAGKPYRQELWIIESGRLLVMGKSGRIYNLRSGDYFGDKSIRAEKGRISSHTAIFEENSTCWVLTREDMESVIGDIKRLGDYLPFVASKSNLDLNKLRDVTKHRILGKGGFGKVWLVSGRYDKIPYALKTMEKRQLIKANQVKAVIREKNIMCSLQHPFLLHLVSSFQDEDNLYLLLELVQGGELFSVVHTTSSNGIEEGPARFYAACVLEALGHLHQRSICYRDLKPENILIDAKGYAIVVDFGFAKVVVDKTYTLCGTPEYLAPEIIMSKGHDKAVDYWSFGVLLFEMLAGQSPFFAPGLDQISMFKRIVLVKYAFPPDDSIEDDARDLIQKLLVRRPADRLGNQRRGHRDVEDHAWFGENVNFKKLLKRRLRAPWIPKLRDPFDSSHFEDFSKEQHAADNGRARSKLPLEKEQQELFKGF